MIPTPKEVFAHEAETLRDKTAIIYRVLDLLNDKLNDTETHSQLTADVLPHLVRMTRDLTRDFDRLAAGLIRAEFDYVKYAETII